MPAPVAIDRRSAAQPEPLERRRLLSSTLFSTGFEKANVAPASFTSTGYAQGSYLTGQPSAGSRFTSSVTTDVTSGSGAAVVASYQATGFTGTASNAQYVQMNDLSGIKTTTSAYYYPQLPSISPVAAGTPVVDVSATVAVISGSNGAAFGLSAFDGTAAENLVADVEVNATTGLVTVDNGARSTGYKQTVSTLTFDVYELHLNYQSQTFDVYEAAPGAAAFTNRIATGVPFETAATTFSTAALDTESVATSGTSTGLGLFDNLTITGVSATPTPTPTASIAGTAFADANGNGKLDAGESGLSGTVVYLDLNKDGQFDSGDKSVTVGSGGTYGFTGLAAGAYVVREVVPAGYSQTAPAGSSYSITLSAGQAVTGDNFGNAPKSGYISGEVFTDANRNGRLDGGDSPLAGATVYLDLNGNGKPDGSDPTYTVGTNGIYLFQSLAAGTYQVREVVPATTQAVTTPAGNLYTVTLGVGQGATGKVFGNAPYAAISGVVFHDANANGRLDAGESLVNGAIVFLDLNKDGKLDAGDVQYKVGANGYYTFNQMPAGSFWVGVVIPTGYSRVTSPAGGTYKVTFAAGQALTGDNFGLA